MSNENLYETVLAAASGAPLAPAKPPRASASVVLWRRAATGLGLEVFWIQRSEQLAFMGGWHAFPGGALAKSDAAVEVTGEPAGGDAPVTAAAMPETLSEGIGSPPPNLVPGIVACALRELLEEVGVLPVEEIFSGQPVRADLAARLAQMQHALLHEQADFAALLGKLDLQLDAGRLTFAGRWLTPPLGPMRFDNRFFLLEWPRALPVQPTVVPGEAEYGEWIAPAEGLAHWQSGAVLAAPPILHLLKVLAEDGPTEDRPGAGLDRLRSPAEANLGPYRRIEFRPGVILLPLPTATLPPASHTNAFLLGRRERVLVDPGTNDPAVLGRVVAVVDALRAAGGEVSAIWLTHHHPDHIGGAAALAQRLGVPICAHRETAERLARGVARLAPIQVDRLLEDGDEIVLAGEPPFPVRVIHTPGHARGHLCFLDVDGGSLLAGDLLSAVSTIVIDPPEGNMDDYLASIAKVAALAPKTLFPAHGPPLKDGATALAKLLAHRLEREDKILAAWNAGLRTPAEIRPRVYEEEIPPMVYPLAERQISAHLERLRRAGRIG